ncbi:MAG: hypothetical protein OXN17_23015 [Candidatus Poribacteria bacterium]|nr:hypothetical protein [Candidatus Poribacteria bacterium]MDE0504214.1 hypothetical protein [Candidatus Poribacteria bacterium]
MKNTSSFKPEDCADEVVQDEYLFDYNSGKRDRFAGKLGQDRLMVCLDADVAAVFKSAESVNHVLRAIITSLPATKKDTS